MRLVLDVENSTTVRNGKKHMDPFEISNHLVQVGMVNADNHDELHIVNIDHDEAKDKSGAGRKLVQDILDITTLLIMHNAQHDLMWLWESGFKYDGLIYDTMLSEYVLDRGQRTSLSLGACAERRNLEVQKDDTLKRYFKEGYNTNEIPLDELSFYLRCDILSTSWLFHSIEADYAKPESESLAVIRDTTFATCKTLTRMYMSGIKVDLQELERVRELFERERAELEDRLQKKVRQIMGDTPVSLTSNEQMSQVIFSRRMTNKKEWVDLFEFTSTVAEYKDAVKANSKPVYRTKAFTCPTCEGQGKTYKTKKDGTRFAKPNKCKDCDTRGFQLTETQQIAGLRFSAPNKSWVSANGFSTSKENLEVLAATARNNNMSEAEDFLNDLKRLSAISSYLSSFVEGIANFTKHDGFLHVALTQHITATGRFSGRNPNMQNMPRGGTFPVKRVFVSRWEGGKIMEADFAQLEFRTAAFLAQDEKAMEEIATGFDVHSYTAQVITDAGQKTSRQDAKAHTFAPLFGATGYGRSKAEAAYYKHFVEKYEGIAAWHKKLGDEAMRFMKITNVSGRQYAFPDVRRRDNGMPSHFTMIKNYPVQGFATGDVVPVVLNRLHELLQPLHSCVVNSVHDSMVVDVHPDEEREVLAIIDQLNTGINDLVEQTYNVTMNVPLLLEAKIGPNWLDTVDV
ncbi:DNA polymerase [Roseobacter phage CRP-207]|jgi:DNA polymerase I-like protein with 3'-5' exonuclease and polymerase domains|nr:DNA polymerase [Roseobacter phage CRP-207]